MMIPQAWFRLLKLTALATLTATVARADWPHQLSDLPPDPAIIWGELDNGFRYALLPHREPPERISIRLRVHAGSLMETDEQQGLAHYLEHMAFNGSENFAPGEMVEYFQRIGMAFGADTNAHTSFDETVYKIDLPENRDDYITDGLRLLRDYADGLLLLQEEVVRERGVILAEMRARDSIDYRTFVANWSFLFSESIIPERMPIGTEEAVRRFMRDDFVSFYEQWYRPERMLLVVVGDIDPEAMAKRIQQTFGSMQAAAPAPAEPDPGELVLEGLHVRLHSEPASPATDVSVIALTPAPNGPDNRESRIRDWTLSLANSMLNTRLERLSRDEASPFTRASVYTFDYLDFFQISTIQLTGEPDAWTETLTLAENITRQALQYGFTESELNQARSALLNNLRQAAAQADTRRSRQLADSLTRTTGRGQVFTHPETNLALAMEVLPELTPLDCLEALREAWGSRNRYIFVTGNLTLDHPEDAIRDTFLAASAEPIMPPEYEEQIEFAYQDFGPAGVITASVSHEDLGIKQWTFANGVRLNVKATDFEQGVIRLGLRVGGGAMAEPESLQGLALLADDMLIAGGLKAHSFDELQRILAGYQVGLNLSVQDNAFVFDGITNRDDLRLQLALTAAYLSEPALRQEAFQQTRRRLPENYRQAATTAEGVMQNEGTRFLAGGNFRFGLPPLDKVMERTREELIDWVVPQLQQGYLEISLVGDLDPDEVVKAVAQTVGALPAREDQKRPDWLTATGVVFPDDVSEKTFYYESQLDRAIATANWPTRDMRDIGVTRRLNLLANIITDRFRKDLREKAGEAYSPFARNIASELYQGYGYTFGFTVADPARADYLAGLMIDAADDLARQGVSEDEFERARLPLLSFINEYTRRNEYWLNRVLMASQEYPETLDWARTMRSDYEAITAEELSALAATYLPRERALKLLIKPQPTPAGE